MSQNAVDSLEYLQTMDELDYVPNIEELSSTIDHLTNGKAAGSDNIPPDLIKTCKSALLLRLHEILCQRWQEGEVPQEMRDVKIITLYKNKGERSDFNSYRGIFFLCIVGKIFARIILIRLQQFAERVYPESQCEFCSGCSKVDMIFSVRQMQEKCREQNMPLYISFIDPTKAFDIVSRDDLFKILTKIGNTTETENLSLFIVICGVLYNMMEMCFNLLKLLMVSSKVEKTQAFGTAEEGIYLRTRTDGNCSTPLVQKQKQK